MTRMRRAAAVMLLCLLSAVVHAGDALQMKVSGMFAEHGDLLVELLVSHDTDNYSLMVTAESATYFTSSEVELDTPDRPRVTVVKFRDLPAGWYEVSGVVFDRNQKVKASSRRTVMVFRAGP